MMMVISVGERGQEGEHSIRLREGIPPDSFSVGKEGSDSAHISVLVVVKLRNF